jgi:hypothetical protein
MTSPTLVWAYKPLIELNGVTGYVDAGELAAPLLEVHAVQSCEPGWEHFLPIQPGPPVVGIPKGGGRRGAPGAPREGDEDATAAAKAAADAAGGNKPRGKVTK